MNDLTIAPATMDIYRVRPRERSCFRDARTDETELCPKKSRAREVLKAYRKRIDALLAMLAAERKQSLLVVLQGVDAAGKDGAVRKVFTGINPQNCRVVSFKEPDREEKAHDYLWRIYRALPVFGEIGIFNRSHYEDVLVPWARGGLKKADARLRLQQIADIERIWTENGIVLRKFFLHISRDEQTKRFKARLENPEKQWKVEDSDFKDRRLWTKFMHGYEECLHRTSTETAPWYVVPSDHKWYRDLVVAGVVLGALESMNPTLPKPELDKKDFKL